MVAVRYNFQYLVTHGDSYPYSLQILSCIKYAFEYTFGACYLFVIANLSPPSLHPLIMVVVVKPTRGQNCLF